MNIQPLIQVREQLRNNEFFIDMNAYAIVHSDGIRHCIMGKVISNLLPDAQFKYLIGNDQVGDRSSRIIMPDGSIEGCCMVAPRLLNLGIKEYQQIAYLSMWKDQKATSAYRMIEDRYVKNRIVADYLDTIIGN